jgi:hypothetical protein
MLFTSLSFLREPFYCTTKSNVTTPSSSPPKMPQLYLPGFGCGDLFCLLFNPAHQTIVGSLHQDNFPSNCLTCAMTPNSTPHSPTGSAQLTKLFQRDDALHIVILLEAPSQFQTNLRTTLCASGAAHLHIYSWDSIPAVSSHSATRKHTATDKLLFPCIFPLNCPGKWFLHLPRLTSQRHGYMQEQ